MSENCARRKNDLVLTFVCNEAAGRVEKRRTMDNFCSFENVKSRYNTTLLRFEMMVLVVFLNRKQKSLALEMSLDLFGTLACEYGQG